MTRIAFARLNQETNALSPVKTTIADFQRDHLLFGPALLQACGEGGVETPGFLKRAELFGFVKEARLRGVEPVPLVSAWAIPGGPLTQSCFDELLQQLTRALSAAGRLDGVYLALHGACGVEGVTDPEAEVITRVRKIVGDVPIAASYDLHGNFTQARARAADATIVYQTNPHRDHVRVGRKAARILCGAAAKEIRPTTAWRGLPMLLGGGNTLDFLPPMRGIFKKLKAFEKRARVLSAGIFTVHPWNAHPELGFSSVVTTDGDPDLAEALADELAEDLWNVRHHLPPRFPSAEEAVDRARRARLSRKLGVVVLADASDVVSAGAPGENTQLVAALLTGAKGMLSYAALRDPVAVKSLFDQPLKSQLRITLGGRLDPSSTALEVEGVLQHRCISKDYGRLVTLAVGDVRIVITEGPALVMKPGFYSAAGLAPWRADLIVVKNFFPFLLYFLPLMRKVIFVRTKGRTDFDAAFDLPFAGPIHPRDVVDDWRSTDRRRREIAL